MDDVKRVRNLAKKGQRGDSEELAGEAGRAQVQAAQYQADWDCSEREANKDRKVRML